DAEIAQFMPRMKSRNPDMAAKLEKMSPAERRKAVIEFRKNRPPRAGQGAGSGNGGGMPAGPP
ncbi:MAG: hypothetical protein PHU85_16360, partial [Phycisphaerae bacterium]|nr:hypothetical protein [Phycisphaerae bacterium]